jgi:hypothetical protein
VGVPPAGLGVSPERSSVGERASGGTPDSAGGTPTLPGNAPPGLAEFIAAYEKLIERFSGGGKRRVVLLQPSPFRDAERFRNLEPYRTAIHRLARTPIPGLGATPAPARFLVVEGAELYQRIGLSEMLRDEVHLTAAGHKELAPLAVRSFSVPVEDYNRVLGSGLEPGRNPELQRLLKLILAKNRLWFDYWRPQNWAFLAGDRTTQPSSRDHLDPSKRWFPPEREAFLPLLEAKEKEIDALAAQLAAGK